MDPAAAPARYDTMAYRRCGRSGLKLPALSLGLWHNFGQGDSLDTARAIARRAFDRGITHFDLANNYGPPPGSAETVFGNILRSDFAAHRDELIVATKAGFVMGPGPYGDGGSRKYLLASLDQSLRRLGLDYVDIFYHHRPDPETPLEETMAALDHAVRSGRALYVGISNYPAVQAREAAAILRGFGTPCLVNQVRYNLLDRQAEHGLLEALEGEGVGCIAYSPLAQGLISDRYLGGGIPDDSRAAKARFLQASNVTVELVDKVRLLDKMARARGQSLAQMALAWLLRRPVVASVLVGASRVSQIDDAVGALAAADFKDAELAAIEAA
jgi:L-glyceraldehyde 3-phosphate reductase